MLNKSSLERTHSHNKVVFNTILWVCSFIILLFLFSGRITPEKIDYIYTICFVITLIIPVSINLYFLIPTYLKKEKNITFSVFFILNLIVFSELNPLFFELIVSSLHHLLPRNEIPPILLSEFLHHLIVLQIQFPQLQFVLLLVQ